MRSSRRPVVVACGLAAVFGLTAATATGCVSAHHADSNTQRNAHAKTATLTISENAIAGGKNAQLATWITGELIPAFQKAEKAKGVDVTVNFEAGGVDDTKYGEKLQLSFKAGGGPDIFPIGGDSVAQYAAAGYIKPLTDVVGDKATSWSGWHDVPKAVQQNVSLNGKYYGIPGGTDGRVLYYNKKLFAAAGLPTDWQPRSWQDILTAGAALKKLSGVTPVQVNAGTPMGEATAMQGFLPLLAGAGQTLQDPKTHRWQGDTTAIRDVLGFYQKLYGPGGLGDPKLQQDPNGRDESFTAFSHDKLGILLESDYLWRSVICPDKAVCNATMMAGRNTDVGYALIPAEKPGAGVGGQDYVSMSGGGGDTINPNTKYPQQAWDLLSFMYSPAQQKAQLGKTVRITANTKVNNATLSGDPALTFIADKVLPITRFRPSDEHYNAVIAVAEDASGQIVAGHSVDDAAKAYQQGVVKALGSASNVVTG